ncbi:alpha-L-fucosidase [Verrucomicrobiota bacterium]
MKSKLILIAAFIFTLSVATFVRAEYKVEPIEDIPPGYEKYVYAPEEHMKWWKDAKFGFFVHWGPAVIGGKTISHSRGRGRIGEDLPDPNPGKIPLEIYDNFYKQFNPVKFNAKEWVDVMKKSGAKYFIFTTKHHDGFSMFDSKYTDYDIMSTPFKRDVSKELADACHEAGIKIFWYLSQPDWHHPDYNTENHPRFVVHLHNQLRELCTNYGKIDGFWFDGLGKNPAMWDGLELLKMIRTLQPGLLVNTRISHQAQKWGDYQTPEQHLGVFSPKRPWETCMTIGGPWSWCGPSEPKSFEYLIRALVRCAGMGGNFALNTGPTPEGTLHEPHVKRYIEIGQWLEKYGDSIYGTRCGPYKPGPFGVSTHKDNRIYLHILHPIWQNDTITIPSPGIKVKSCRALTGGKPKFKEKNDKLEIKLASKHHNQMDTIIELELDGQASGIEPEKISLVPLNLGKKASCSSFRISRNKKMDASSLVKDKEEIFSRTGRVAKQWSAENEDEKPWVMLDLGKPMKFNHIVAYAGKGHARKYWIEYKDDSGKWQTFLKGEKLSELSEQIEPITAQYVRLNLGKSANIETFDLYYTE